MAPINSAQLDRARGCLLGQLAGDSLGSLVEFRNASDILAQYPNGVTELANGGHWNTLAGQPTDDSELALLLARMLIQTGRYQAETALHAYRRWLESIPFDCGLTILLGLNGRPNSDSQANGAMMRISPLAIFGALHPSEQVGDWAMQDAALTHPNPICMQANRLYCMAISTAIREGTNGKELYDLIVGWAEQAPIETDLMTWIHQAAEHPPAEYHHQMGWVRIAFGNALWQLLHADDLRSGVIDTVMRGGDTDTNGAICGALLGAVYGQGKVPTQWKQSIFNCRPEATVPDVAHPRPREMWPVDALELAEQLLEGGCRHAEIQST